FDQRGTGFDRVVCGGVDVGAFELQQIDLAITKTADQQSYPAGGTIVYTFKVENLGGANATGVTISDALPAHTSFVASENVGWALANGAYHYTVGNVPAAGTAPDVN